MGLYQLIYQSQSLVPFEQPELIALLQQAGAFNRENFISGLLLYTPDGRFLQVLEGERNVVRKLFYNSIVHDPRHSHCRVISEGPCLRRSFASWSMGFRTANPKHLRTILGYVPPDTPGLLVTRPHTRPELMALLEEFINECETEPTQEYPW
jgi:hypothetical protein